MNDNTILSLGAMVVIGAIEIVALLQGIDGQILSVVVAALAGLGGYRLARGRRNKYVSGAPS